MGKINIPTNEVISKEFGDTNVGFVTKSDVENLGDAPTESGQGEQEDNNHFDEFIELLPIKRALDIPMESTVHDTKLRYLTGWAKEKYGDKFIQGIHKLANKIGVGNIGEDNVSELYNYVRISNQFNSFKKLKEAMEKK